ncbi:MAG TPA: hypothetical protein VF209_03755 [Patescibacteria group bacterium]
MRNFFLSLALLSLPFFTLFSVSLPSSGVSVQAQEAEWDGSRLEFLECDYDANVCGEIRTAVCNRGTGAMTGTSTWEVYYSPAGDPLTEGTLVGSGTVIPLPTFDDASWAACLLIIHNPTYAGNYRFLAYQRPGSPDATATSELVIMNACPAPPASPSPSPTVTSAGTGGPQPTPTPGPSGKEFRLNTDRLVCPNTTFDAVADVLDHGRGIGNVKVTFTFNGQTKETTTNDDGRAKVTFDSSADGTLIAKAEGFEDRSYIVEVPACEEPAVGVGGPSSSERETQAEVLGATTLADTGRGQDFLALMLISTGFMLTAVSYLGMVSWNRK